MALYLDPETGEEFEVDGDDDDAPAKAKRFGLVSEEEFEYSRLPLGERAENTAAGVGASIARGVLSPIEVGARVVAPETAAELGELRRESYGSPEALKQRERDPILSGIAEQSLPIATGVLTGGAGLSLRAAGSLMAAESALTGVTTESIAATEGEREFDVRNAAAAGAVDLATGLGAHGLMRLASLGPRQAAGQAMSHGAGVLYNVSRGIAGNRLVGQFAKDMADDLTAPAFKLGGAATGFGIAGPPGAVAGYWVGKRMHKVLMRPVHGAVDVVQDAVNKAGPDVTYQQGRWLGQKLRNARPMAARAAEVLSNAARKYGPDGAGAALLTAGALGYGDDPNQDPDVATAGLGGPAGLVALGMSLLSRRVFGPARRGVKAAAGAVAEAAPAAGRAAADFVAENAALTGKAVAGLGGKTARLAGGAISRNAEALREGAGAFGRSVASDPQTMMGVGRALGGTLGGFAGPLGSELGSKAGEYAVPKLTKSLLDWFARRSTKTSAENVADAVTEAAEKVAARPEVAAVAHEAAKEFAGEATEAIEALAKQTAQERALSMRGAPSRLGGNAKAQREALINVIDGLSGGLGKSASTDIYSKSGRPDYAWKGTARQAASYDARIAAYAADPRFQELVQEHAAITRRTPFGPGGVPVPGKERELWELQKDILDEHENLFPRVPYEAPTPQPDAVGVQSAASDFASKARAAILGARTSQERFRIGIGLTETLTEHAARSGDAEMAKVFGAYAERLWETMGRSELWLSPKQLQQEGKRALKRQAKLLQNVAQGEEAAEAMVRGDAPADLGNPARPIDTEAVAIGTGLSPVFERAVTRDEWLTTFPTRAAREAAEEELDEAIVETFETFGRVPRRDTVDWALAEQHVIAERMARAKKAGQRGMGALELTGALALAGGALVGANVLARARRQADEEISFDELEGLPPEDAAAVLRTNGKRFAEVAQRRLVDALDANGAELERARRAVPAKLAELAPEASEAQRGLVVEVYDQLDDAEQALRDAGADEAADGIADAADRLTPIAVAHTTRMPVEHDAGDALQELAGIYDSLSMALPELPPAVGDVVEALRVGTEKRELWGEAADMLTDLRRNPSAELGADPLDGDSVRNYVESSRGMLDVYERWGLADEGLRESVDGVDLAEASQRSLELEMSRHGLSLLDAGEDPEDAGPARQALAAAMAEAGVAGDPSQVRDLFPPGVLEAFENTQRAYRYDETLRAIERGVTVSVRRAARGAAGLGPSTADSAIDATTAAFADGYSDEVAAFEARRRQLETIIGNPMALQTALASSFGDMPDTHPDAFAELGDMTARAASVLVDAMPPSLLESYTNPQGLPPSIDDVRSFARVYMAVTEPRTYLRDLGSGQAWPEQSQAFAKMYPQQWSRLAEEAVTAARERGPMLAPQDASYLDLTFGIGNNIGGMWSDAGAAAIRDANAARAQQQMERAQGLGQPKPASGAPRSATAALSSGPSNTPV